MFKLNRKIEYALIALKHMDNKEEKQLTSAKEICDTYQTPFDPTSRVLQIMSQNGILHAEQGAKGGYKIVSDLSQFSMRKLSEMITGPIEIASCITNGDTSSCDIGCHCQIISPMLNLNENINKLFERIMIADLLHSQHISEEDVRTKINFETAT